MILGRSAAPSKSQADTTAANNTIWATLLNFTTSLNILANCLIVQGISPSDSIALLRSSLVYQLRQVESR